MIAELLGQTFVNGINIGALYGLAAVTSEDGQYVFALAWPNPRSILSNADIPCLHADPIWPECAPGKRVYLRGKLFVMKGTLNDVLQRVRREVARAPHEGSAAE